MTVEQVAVAIIIQREAVRMAGDEEKAAGLRAAIQIEAAKRRVDRAVLLPGRMAVVEMPAEALSRDTAWAHGEALVAVEEMLSATCTMLDAQVLDLGHDRFDPVFARSVKRWGAGRLDAERSRSHGAASITPPFRLARLGSLLMAPRGREVDDVGDSAGPEIELLRAAIETAGRLATLSAVIGAGIAELRGARQVAIELLDVAGVDAVELAQAVAVIETVHGVTRTLDPSSSAGSKIEAALQIGGGLARLADSWPDAPGAGGAISGLIAAGPLVAHADLSDLASAVALAGLRPRFGFMAYHAMFIRETADTLVKARLLMEGAPDPSSRRGFQVVADQASSTIGATIEYLLKACLRSGSQDPSEPGENLHLRDAFAELQPLDPPVSDPDAALRRAHLVVTRVSEVLEDAPRYVRLSIGLERAPGRD